MEKTYHISDREKGQITAFKELGWSNLQISKHLGRHHSSIAYFIRNQENSRPKRKPGPKEKLRRKC